VGRWWLISAVARAYQPGCQCDHMMVLEGSQGAGKSQAVRALGSPWTLGTLPDIRDAARAADTIASYWIIEVAELDALKGANMTRIKDFVSQQVDVYRAAYARKNVARARSCVFVGTTNEKNYLSDPTGARRFWPVEVNKADLDAIRADRPQIWAEALMLYEAGEQWHPDQSLAKTIEEEQEARREQLPLEGVIADYVAASEEDNIPTTDMIRMHCVNHPLGAKEKTDPKAVSAVMHRLGYVENRGRDANGKQPRGRWKKKPDAETAESAEPGRADSA
jgi:putative DNA primase/helicase